MSNERTFESVALVNTSMMDADMVKAKEGLVSAAATTGYIDENGNPVYVAEAKIEENGNITFKFDGQPVGCLYHPKDGGFLSRIEATKLAKDTSKVWAFVGEEGRRLKVAALEALELKKARGEEVTEADMEMLASENDLVNAVVIKGVYEKKEVNDIVSYLESNRVASVNIKYVLAKELIRVESKDGKVSKPPMPFREPAPTADKFGNIVDNGILNRALSALRLKQHIILDGPKGTGKDVLLESIAWATGRPFISHTMTMDVTKEDLLGDYITDNSKINLADHQKFLGAIGGEDGLKAALKYPEEAEDTINLMAEVFKPRVVFEPSSVVTALRIGRCILNFDEMNLANTGVLSGVVNTIADNHSSYIYVRGAGKVAITGETWVTATMNGLDCDYEGTQPLNEATDDRFKTIRFSNPTGSVFDILMGLNTGASTTEIKIVDDLYQCIRDLYVLGIDGVEGAISSKAVSMRACRRMLLDLVDGVTPYEAFRDNILNKLTKDDADIIYSVVTARGIIKLPVVQ